MRTVFGPVRFRKQSGFCNMYHCEHSTLRFWGHIVNIFGLRKITNEMTLFSLAFSKCEKRKELFLLLLLLVLLLKGYLIELGILLNSFIIHTQTMKDKKRRGTNFNIILNCIFVLIVNLPPTQSVCINVCRSVCIFSTIINVFVAVFFL